MATFDCSVLRRALTPPADHRSSTSRSARTSAPASSARRTTSSEVFPLGHRHALAVAGDLERTEHRHGEHLSSVCPSGQDRRQVAVSGSSAPTEHSERMPTDIEVLLRRLIGGDATAPAEILDRAETDDSPALLVAAALVSRRARRAAGSSPGQRTSAATTRDRQLVAIATAHLNDDADLLDALVRDHLSDHPDNVLAAWIAAQHTPPACTSQTSPDSDQREERRHVRNTFEGP